jgi:hypothetical protein
MWLNRKFVRANKVNVAIVLFLICFITIHTLKPTLIYDEDGGFRPFGVGYRHKTIVPIWIVAIILGIFSYLTVLYYITM